MFPTNERIRKLRKALDLTQSEFARRIGSSQNSMANYETGHRNPSSSVINNICKEFHVSEEWLRTGSGEMFITMTRDDEIAAFVEKVLHSESDSFKRRFIAALCHLNEAGWEALDAMITEIAAKKDAAPAADQGATPPVPDIAAELAELKRQNQALAAKVAAMEEEDAIETGLSPSVSAGSFSPGQKAEQ